MQLIEHIQLLMKPLQLFHAVIHSAAQGFVMIERDIVPHNVDITHII